MQFSDSLGGVPYVKTYGATVQVLNRERISEKKKALVQSDALEPEEGQ